MAPSSLTDAQLRAALRRCRTCETRPCRSGCPAGCSPAEFILAARCGEPSDLRRAAAHILGHNPLGGVCGSVCPDALCMARCSRRELDGPVDIPGIQAAIVRRARELGGLPAPDAPVASGQRVAVVGAGPAGLGATAVLARAGHTVHVFDAARRAGGMARLIPGDRLDPAVLDADVAGIVELGDVHLRLGRAVPLPRDLLARGFAAVVVCAGLGQPARLGVPGEARAIPWTRFLARPPALRGRRVAVVGDGAAAVDCAEVAVARGAAHVELLARKALFELGLGRRDRDRLLAAGVHLTGRVRVAAIRGRGARVTAVELRRLELPAGQAFHPRRLSDLPGGVHERRDLDTVVLALGGEPAVRREPHPRVIYAGDLELGPTSVVEALASGKRAALEVHRLLSGDELAACPDRGACADGSGCPRRASCPEWSRPAAIHGGGAPRPPAGLPVPLATGLLGLELSSPLLLGPRDAPGGHAQLRRAYEAGWAGAVLTSGALDRLCDGVDRLRREFPDRLTIAALDRPGSGDPDAEARAVEAETRSLDAAGALAVQYALRPSRDGRPLDPESAARVVDAALGAGAPGVPRLFELAADAGALDALLARLAAAFARHPGRPAGVTLVAPPAAPAAAEALRGIARAAAGGLTVSYAVDALDHRAAAAALARGARTVQVGAAAARYGVRIVTELHAGLAWFLAERGLRSPGALAGEGAAATPALAASIDVAACARCGNCTRCPHLAITLDGRGLPAVERARCTGCGACIEQCFTGALALAAA